jgi:GTP-binding protein Era
MNGDFKSGFISIIGKPNVGKSTLLNAILKQTLAITTPKAQTTRHRILGIFTDDTHQLVFSDTPGIMEPAHQLHKEMMVAVDSSLEDADIIIYMMEVGEKLPDEKILSELEKANVPLALVLNKAETIAEEDLNQLIEDCKTTFAFKAIIPVSALHGLNLNVLMNYLKDVTPVHPAYFPSDQLSDRDDRFFVSEFVRKHVLLQYNKEIPYAVEVVVTAYKEDVKIDHIEATVFVERESQKGILIGKGGEALKKLGTAARLDIEEYLGKKIFLGLRIKVKEKWRSDERMLKYFGYVK